MNDVPRAWTGDDVRLIEGVARELRVALETARLLESRERESDRLLALHRASTELATHTDTNTVIESILRNAVTLLGGGSGSFFRWDAEAGVAAAGPDLADARRGQLLRVPPGRGAGRPGVRRGEADHHQRLPGLGPRPPARAVTGACGLAWACR